MSAYQGLGRRVIGLGLFCSLSVLSGQVLAQIEPLMSEEVFWDDVPMVMSATRMSQSANETPMAVTVIDRRMIDASGAREIPELFRLVPGFIVGYQDGGTPSVNYHMSVDRYARQMQVLIDGRSIYTTVFGGIPWATLQVTIDDIDRIEVVRGPNSASYGANSFLGVINIITRNPVFEDSSVKINIGDGGVREVFLRHAGEGEKVDYRVTAGVVEDEGFAKRYDSKRTKTFSVRADYSLTTIDTLSFEGGVGTGPRGVQSKLSLFPRREKTVLNHQQQIKWERRLSVDESLSVQLYHIFQRNSENFTTASFPLGVQVSGFDLVLDPMPVNFSRYTHRYELGFQHNVSLTDELRTAWGGGFRSDEVWGAENLMGDEKISNYLRYGFMNLEWSPATKAWVVNAGAMVEDYSTTGTNISPRVGINYQLTPKHGIRVTTSQAVRTPSMLEYAALYALNGPMTLYNGSTAVGPAPADLYAEFWRGNRDTGVEKIISYELGYHGMPLPGMLELDAKIYFDELTDVLDLQDFPQPLDNLDRETSIYVNNDWITIQGVELEAKISFANDSALHLGYAYTEVYDKLRAKPIMKAPQNSFNILYMMSFGHSYNAGIGFYFIDRIQGWESSRPPFVRDQVRRLDLKVAKSIELSGFSTELAISARNVLGRYEEMEILRPQSDFSYSNEIQPSAYLTIKVQLN